MSSLESRAKRLAAFQEHGLLQGRQPNRGHDSAVEPELEESLRRLHAMTQAGTQRVVAPRYAETAGASTSVSRRKSDMTAALSNGSRKLATTWLLSSSQFPLETQVPAGWFHAWQVRTVSLTAVLIFGTTHFRPLPAH